ncbi:MAG: T9SS type A sorting domain-containing protein, partial [Bacteroidota bacterium]
DGLTNLQEFNLMTDPYVYDTITVGVEKPILEPIYTYPNPAYDVVRITGTQEFSQVEVVDMQGRIVQRAGRTRLLDVRQLVPGMYFLRLLEDDLVRGRTRFEVIR